MATPTPTPTPKKAVALRPSDITKLFTDGFRDPKSGGDVTWKTLISSPTTPTDSLTVGIATCAPAASSGCRGTLKPHRHVQAEVYHFTQGRGVVTVDGEAHRVGKGSVVWIPGNAEHGVENVGGEDLVWLYVFAVDGFKDVGYRFDEAGPGRERARG